MSVKKRFVCISLHVPSRITVSVIDLIYVLIRCSNRRNSNHSQRIKASCSIIPSHTQSEQSFVRAFRTIIYFAIETTLPSPTLPIIWQGFRHQRNGFPPSQVQSESLIPARPDPSKCRPGGMAAAAAASNNVPIIVLFLIPLGDRFAYDGGLPHLFRLTGLVALRVDRDGVSQQPARETLPWLSVVVFSVVPLWDGIPSFETNHPINIFSQIDCKHHYKTKINNRY